MPQCTSKPVSSIVISQVLQTLHRSVPWRAWYVLYASLSYYTTKGEWGGVPGGAKGFINNFVPCPNTDCLPHLIVMRISFRCSRGWNSNITINATHLHFCRKRCSKIGRISASGSKKLIVKPISLLSRYHYPHPSTDWQRIC